MIGIWLVMLNFQNHESKDKTIGLSPVHFAAQKLISEGRLRII